jgi:HEAT repeat protein
MHGTSPSPAAGAEPARRRLVVLAELAELPDDEAGQQLTEVALRHEEAAMRAEAMHMLGERGGPGALSVLQHGLHDSHRRVRESALHAASVIGGNDAAQLVGAALGSADPAFRLAVVETLGNIGGAQVSPYLQQALQDEREVIRDAAAQWLDEWSAARGKVQQ